MKYINFHIIIKILGILLMLNGSAMLISSLIDLHYNEGVFRDIFAAGFLALVVGFCMYFIQRNASKNLGKKEGYLIVSLGWLILTLSGALPYVFTEIDLWQTTGETQNSFCFTNAFFESMSGYTTTGATILNDIESVPKALLFWRSFTHWIGGMGIIVLTIAILPLLGVGGMQLFVAEAPGITADKLHPRITETAKRLWVIYAAFTLIETVLLYVAGMSFYDAINHAFSTMSTGGFSTKNASMAYWDNEPIIQYIIIIFMFIAGMNFVLAYFLLKGKWKKISQNDEFKYYAGIIIGTGLILSFLVWQYSDPTNTTLDHTSIVQHANGENHFTLESSIRHSFFAVITVITTTGFVSADFSNWSAFAGVIIFALMFLGGMAGSTAGGVKVIRHVILLKNSWNEFKKMMHPSAIIPLRINGSPVPQQIIFNVLAFFMIYMLIFIVGSIIMGMLFISQSPDNKEYFSILTVTASSLGNIGPAFGYFSPVDNFNMLTPLGKWFSSFLMLLGRLELFTILVLFTPSFWRR